LKLIDTNASTVLQAEHKTQYYPYLLALNQKQ